MPGSEITHSAAVTVLRILGDEVHATTIEVRDSAKAYFRDVRARGTKSMIAQLPDGSEVGRITITDPSPVVRWRGRVLVDFAQKTAPTEVVDRVDPDVGGLTPAAAEFVDIIHLAPKDKPGQQCTLHISLPSGAEKEKSRTTHHGRQDAPQPTSKCGTARALRHYAAWAPLLEYRKHIPEIPVTDQLPDRSFSVYGTTATEPHGAAVRAGTAPAAPTAGPRRPTAEPSVRSCADRPTGQLRCRSALTVHGRRGRRP